MSDNFPQIISSIFNKDNLFQDSTDVYNTIVNEVPEIINNWVYIVFYNSDKLNQIQQSTPDNLYNFYTYSFNTTTFYKKISIGNVYKHTYVTNPVNGNLNGTAYWITLDNPTPEWLLTSVNYQKAIENKFMYLWYCLTNFKLDVNTTLSLGYNYYSQPIYRRSTDIEIIDSINVYEDYSDNNNSSLFLTESKNFNWICQTTEPYLRIHLQGYKI